LVVLVPLLLQALMTTEAAKATMAKLTYRLVLIEK
jgi:hypothetical protein